MDAVDSSAKNTNDDQFVDAGKDLSKMAAASKELSPEKKEENNSDASSIGAMIYSAVKKIVLVGGIYLVGYMGWSVAWLIGESPSDCLEINCLSNCVNYSSARANFGDQRGVAQER